jgi:hypothetical protein
LFAALARALQNVLGPHALLLWYFGMGTLCLWLAFANRK